MDERIVAFEEGREEEGVSTKMVSVVLIVTDWKTEFKEEEEERRSQSTAFIALIL